MTPQKAEKQIWLVSKELGLTRIVEKNGVDRIWELVKEQSDEDIFTPLHEICVDVINQLV